MTLALLYACDNCGADAGYEVAGHMLCAKCAAEEDEYQERELLERWPTGHECGPMCSWCGGGM